MKPVRTHTFNGTKYDIDLCGPIDGVCDGPVGERPSIRITTEPETRNELISLIHEGLHAEGWAVTESVVDRVSSEIGTFLWRLGFRRRER